MTIDIVQQKFSLSLAAELLESSEGFPIDFDMASQWLGYTRKDNAKRAFLNAGFIEGIDYLIHEELPTTSVPRPEQKTSMTVDCLKNWGMLSGTEQGKNVRKYFLDCERVAKAKQSKPQEAWAIPETLEDALIFAANQIKERKAEALRRELAEAKSDKLMLQIEATAPATALGQLIEGAVNDIRIGDFAKSIGMGQNRYFDQLRSDGIIQQMPSTVPYQKWINSGYFKVTQIQQQTSKGIKTFPVALITPKGQLWLAKRHKREQALVTIEAQVSAVV
jgi:anti-repressor protein